MAPEIAVLLRIHCSFVVVSAVSQVGAVEVSWLPTLPLPEMTGSAVTIGPGARLPTTAALAELPVPNSAEVPVTTTVIEASMSSTRTAYVVPEAPSTVAPLRRHS